jgi:phosphate transport system permease protein
MSSSAASAPRRFAFTPRRLRDRFGDGVLHVITAGAALAVLATAGLIVYELIKDSKLTREAFGFSFITSRAWDPVKGQFGALDFIYGTIYTSLVAVVIAGPAAIAIALFLTELAPRWTRTIIATLVDLLAAIPSVVIGLWGIFILGPIIKDDLGPFLSHWFGWLPFFKGTPQLEGYLAAVIVLAVMMLPITAAVARELFVTVPRELKDGALALGATRWEMIRGVILPQTRGGLVAAVMLGLGRAIGEAIAVTQVIGDTLGIHISLFEHGDTLASRIAAQYQGASTDLQRSALVELALVLLVFSLISNVVAQVIVRRFERQLGKA